MDQDQQAATSAYWGTYPARPAEAVPRPGLIAGTPEAALTTPVALTDDEAMVVYALRLVQRAAIGGITPVERAALAGTAEILRRLNDYCQHLVGGADQQPAIDAGQLNVVPTGKAALQTAPLGSRARSSRARKRS